MQSSQLTAAAVLVQAEKINFLEAAQSLKVSC